MSVTAVIQSKLLFTAQIFVELLVELSALFIAISFFVSLLNQKIPKEKIQKILGANRGGYLVAAGLGAITPFCSCSTIPLLIGLLKSRVAFGPIMTFLFTSPLLNPIILVLFIPVLGIKSTIAYALLVLSLSCLIGALLQRFGLERYVRQELLTSNEYVTKIPTGDKQKMAMCKNAWRESVLLFKSVFPYLLIAMIIGSVVHGFVPANFFSEFAGADNTMAVPIAALIGIPLYIRITSLIPLVGAFIAKGVSIGAVIALVIGSGGASIPELILLNKLFKWQLLVVFLSVIFSMAVIGGFTFNALLS